MPADWRVRTSDHGPVLERIPGVVVDCDIASWSVEVDGSENDVCYGGFFELGVGGGTQKWSYRNAFGSNR